MDNYKGFELFKDIEDAVLRNRNRAVVLANIAQDHTKNNKVSVKGASLILGYFNNIPGFDRDSVKDNFQSEMQSRGYVLGV